MYCSKCGNELKENARFCDMCGFKVQEKNDIKGRILINQKNKKVFIIGLVLIMILLGLIVVLVKKSDTVYSSKDVIDKESTEEIRQNENGGVSVDENIVVKYSMDEISLKLPCDVKKVLKGSKKATYALEIMTEYEYERCSLESAKDEEIRAFIDYNEYGRDYYSLCVVPTSPNASGAMLGWVYINDLMLEGILFSQAQGYYWEEIMINELSVTDTLETWVNVLGTDNWRGINYLNNEVLCWDMTPWKSAIAIEIDNLGMIQSIFIGNDLENYIDSQSISYIPTENSDVAFAAHEDEGEKTIENKEQIVEGKALSLDEIIELSNTSSDGITAVHRENEFYVLTKDDNYMWGRRTAGSSMADYHVFDNVLFAEQKEFILMPGDEIVTFSEYFSDDEVEISLPKYYFKALPFWIDELSILRTSSRGSYPYIDYILDKNGMDDIPSGEVFELNGESFDINSCEYLYYAYDDEDIYPMYAIRCPEENNEIQVGLYQGTQYLSYVMEPVWFWSGYDREKYLVQHTRDGYTVLLDSAQLEEIKKKADRFMMRPESGIFNLINY